MIENIHKIYGVSQKELSHIAELPEIDMEKILFGQYSLIFCGLKNIASYFNVSLDQLLGHKKKIITIIFNCPLYFPEWTS